MSYELVYAVLLHDGPDNTSSFWFRTGVVDSPPTRVMMDRYVRERMLARFGKRFITILHSDVALGGKSEWPGRVDFPGDGNDPNNDPYYEDAEWDSKMRKEDEAIRDTVSTRDFGATFTLRCSMHNKPHPCVVCFFG